MTKTTVPSRAPSTQTPQQHLNALFVHLQSEVERLRGQVLNRADELAMIQEDLRAKEEMLNSVMHWWEEGILAG